MKNRSIFTLGITLAAFIGLVIWSLFSLPPHHTNKNADIRLLGEQHGAKHFYNMELEEWQKCYTEEGMRHLFVELPYHGGEFLNIWMHEDSDAILDEMFKYIKDTDSGTPDYMDFFRSIKQTCPETVFHGTDVGHQYKTMGARYLEYLEENGMADSENYRIAKDNIEQGKLFHDTGGDLTVREPYMISNFIREYDKIENAKILGIYGGYHVDTTSPDIMAGALKVHYGDKISCTILTTKTFRNWKRLPHFGISFTGIVFLAMLFIPNIIWTKKKPDGYDESAKNENRTLLIFERIGEALVTALVLTDRRLDLFYLTAKNFIVTSPRLGYLLLGLVLMVLYELYWVKYFRSKRTLADFYCDFCGFPLAGALLPVCTAALLGVYACNAFIIAAAIILGVGHIGIHAQHKTNIGEQTTKI